MLPLESLAVNTCVLELPARTQTAIQFPTVLFEVNASCAEVVVPASLLVRCTSTTLLCACPSAPPRNKKRERVRDRLRRGPIVENMWRDKLISKAPSGKPFAYGGES